MAESFVVLPDEGQTFDMGTFQAVVLASGAQTQDSFSILRTQNEPPGFGPPLHIHHDAAEAFYVLRGEYRMFVPSGEYRCGPGSFVYVPRGVPHTFQVVSEVPGEKLNLFAPSAMVSFFSALAEAEGAGDVTPDMLEQIALASHMEVVGPVPDTYL
jgi:mannose-6-phosphate isomerase-like protein (cupin superfamily)